MRTGTILNLTRARVNVITTQKGTRLSLVRAGQVMGGAEGQGKQMLPVQRQGFGLNQSRLKH